MVANEVKDLAQEMAEATDDIRRRITAIQADTGAATNALCRMGTVVETIYKYQATIASAVEERTATTGEMSRSVAEVEVEAARPRPRPRAPAPARRRSPATSGG